MLNNQSTARGRTSLKINISTGVVKQSNDPNTMQNSSASDCNGKPEAAVASTHQQPQQLVSRDDEGRHQADVARTTETSATVESPSRKQETVNTQRRSSFYEVTRCMLQLYTVDIDSEASHEALLSNLEYIQRCIEVGRPAAIINQLISYGVIELCQQLCRTLFHRPDFLSPPSKTSSSRRLTTLTLGVAATLTDGSKEACRRLLDVEFHNDLFAYLRSDTLDPGKVKYTSWTGYIVDCFLALLYNVIQVVTEARELYRDQQAASILQKFRTNTTESVSCMALILQAYVINEEEIAASLGSDPLSCFRFLADELRSTFEDPDEHRSRNGYRAVELLAAVNKLAVADHIKPLVVESGAVDSYVRLIRVTTSGVEQQAASISSLDEQLAACMGLWTLAMSCADKLLQHPSGCVDALKALFTTTSDDKIKRQASGALEALCSRPTKDVGDQHKDVNTDQQLSSLFTGASYGDQVFISYNHASKAMVLRLSDRLKAAGFCVWVDDEGVFESIADDIIKGLDRATVVLACMTQKYYESPYCKKEVVYAAESYKKIIPLTLEPRYNPHGWLRFHTSDGLRYDFSNDDNFEDSFKKLSQTLRVVLRNSAEKTPGIGQQSSPPALIVPDHQSNLQSALSPLPAEAPAAGKSVRGWTMKEVNGWLYDNDLQHLTRWFSGFDGEMLLEYRLFRHGAPETQAACYQDERQHGRLSVADVIKLSRALKRLQ